MTKQQDRKDKFETAKTELNEAELEKVTGGGGAGAGKVTFLSSGGKILTDSSSPNNI